MYRKRNLMKQHGILGTEYADGRVKSRALKYRLWRRTHEVREAISYYLDTEVGSIIDLGTAEGRMLNELSTSFPRCDCTGVEYNKDLVRLGRTLFPHLNLLHGDVENLRRFRAKSFDVAVATAVIEHVLSPEKFISEVSRIVRPGGLLIMTAPDPFWEKIATFVGHLADEQHNHVPNLGQMQQLASFGGFEILCAKKFMISPIGMPWEFQAERVLEFVNLSLLMANQLVVARR